MSMISKQIKELRKLSEDIKFVTSLRKIFSEAADTIESLSAKLQAANMERSAQNCGGWISCKERLPEEHESVFARFKGTDKWQSAMFEKISSDVNVTIENEKGERATITAHTIDGKWKLDDWMKAKVLAWQPLPEPYHEP